MELLKKKNQLMVHWQHQQPLEQRSWKIRKQKQKSLLFLPLFIY